MRRGLIQWSKIELPEAVFDRRLARLQAHMSRQRLDAFVAYTNHTRPAAVSWLTGFIPYWSEGLVLVPRSGVPTLFVALSKRVQGWIERTARIESVVSTPRIAREAARALAATVPQAAIGVLELDDLPTVLADDLIADGAVLADATATFDALRGSAEASEIALAAHAAAIAHAALDTVSAEALDVAASIALVEGSARRAGAEDVFVAVAADLTRDASFVRSEGTEARFGAVFALRATVAYKGTWVRVVRAFARDAARRPAIERAAEGFAATVARLPDAAALTKYATWSIEATRRSQPLEAIAGSHLGASPVVEGGALVSIGATTPVEGVLIPFGVPALTGTGEGAGALLASPLARGR